MINRQVGWQPDSICSCKVIMGYDELDVKAEHEIHIQTTETCPDHQGLSGQALIDELTSESRGLSYIRSYILENIADVSKDVVSTTGTTEKEFRNDRIFNYYFTGNDSNRVFHFDVKGKVFSTQERQEIKAVADTLGTKRNEHIPIGG